ncbi:MAG: PaaI family thioesterase [Sneathiellaceae bacterium]
MTGSQQVPPGFSERPTRGAFARLIGPYFERPGADPVLRGFQVEERHTNALGIAHGGMVMSFLDSVLAGAVGRVAKGSFVTLRMTTDFLAPARLGDWVEGQAVVTRATRSVCYVRGEARVGSRRVASADAVFRLLQRQHPEMPDPAGPDPKAGAAG